MIVMYACMLEVNFAKVVGTKRDNILTAITGILNKKLKLPDISPFGDGNAGKKKP